MSLANLLIIALAIFRVTQLLVNEEGPFEIFDKLRSALGVVVVSNAAGEVIGHHAGKSKLSQFILCHKCVSVWVSFVILPISLLNIRAVNLIIYCLAASGAEVILGSVLDKIELE